MILDQFGNPVAFEPDPRFRRRLGFIPGELLEEDEGGGAHVCSGTFLHANYHGEWRRVGGEDGHMQDPWATWTSFDNLSSSTVAAGFVVRVR